MGEVFLGDTSDQYGLYDIDLLKSFYVLVQSQQTQQHLVEKAKLEDQVKELKEEVGQIPELKVELESLKNQIAALTQETTQTKTALTQSNHLLKSVEAKAE